MKACCFWCSDFVKQLYTLYIFGCGCESSENYIFTLGLDRSTDLIKLSNTYDYHGLQFDNIRASRLDYKVIVRAAAFSICFFSKWQIMKILHITTSFTDCVFGQKRSTNWSRNLNRKFLVVSAELIQGRLHVLILYHSMFISYEYIALCCRLHATFIIDIASSCSYRQRSKCGKV